MPPVDKSAGITQAGPQRALTWRPPGFARPCVFNKCQAIVTNSVHTVYMYTVYIRMLLESEKKECHTWNWTIALPSYPTCLCDAGRVS